MFRRYYTDSSYTPYSQMNNCYTVGTLNSESTSFGDILGADGHSSNYANVSYKNCFYLMEKNPNSTYTVGVARSDDALQGVGAYSNFDFSSVWTWDTSGNYPYAILQRIGVPGSVCKHSVISVPEQEATCTEDGYRAHYRCTLCNKLFTDAKGENETTLDALIILAGHRFTTKPSGELASEATYTEAAKYYVQCDHCDAIDRTKTVSVGEPKQADPGDLDMDGNVTSVDLVLLAEHLLGRKTLTEAQQKLADLNGDGLVTAADMVLLAKLLLR